MEDMLIPKGINNSKAVAQTERGRHLWSIGLDSLARISYNHHNVSQYMNKIAYLTSALFSLSTAGKKTKLIRNSYNSFS